MAGKWLLVAVVGLVFFSTSSGAELVKECSFGSNTAHDDPCQATLFLGDEFTVTCGASDTSEPTGFGSQAKYCTTPITGDDATCDQEESLSSDVGAVSRSDDKVTVKLSDSLHMNFGYAIDFYVRCTRGNQRLYVKARLFPFERPPKEYRKDAVPSPDSSAKNPTVLYNFKDTSTLSCPGSFPLGTTFVPSATGYCRFPVSAVGRCPRKDMRKWPAGITAELDETKKKMTIKGDKFSFPQFLTSFHYCSNGENKLWAAIYFLGVPFNPPTQSLVEGAKKVCSTGSESNVADRNTTCQGTLEVGETAVINCAHMNFLENPGNFKLYPANVNQEDGDYCETPAIGPSFDRCLVPKKWPGLKIRSNTIGGYFTITNDLESAKKRDDFRAIGWCSRRAGPSMQWNLLIKSYKPEPPSKVVKHCEFSKDGSPSNACEVSLFLGESLSYSCAGSDDASPAGKGKYCEEPFKGDSDACSKEATLDDKMGEVARASRKTFITLREKVDDSFDGVKNFHVRCINGSDATQKVFVKARFFPFARPAKENTMRDAHSSSNASHEKPSTIVNFKEVSTIDCSSVEGTLEWKPAKNEYCKVKMDENFKCRGLNQDWSGTDITVTEDGKKLKFDGSNVHPGWGITAYVACTGSAHQAWVSMTFTGLVLNLPKEDEVLGAKHICSTGKTAETCVNDLEVGETIVINCSHLLSNGWDKFSKIPGSVDQAGGEYCAEPLQSDGFCANAGKWTDVQVRGHYLAGYFTITNNLSDARKRKDFSAYGVCKDANKSLSWQVNVKGAKKDPPDTVVAHCDHNTLTTKNAPCEVPLFSGESFSYQCASDDTAFPVGANSYDGKYCANQLTGIDEHCIEKSLSPDVGDLILGNGKVYVSLHTVPKAKFNQTVTYFIRCTLKDNERKRLFVKAIFNPFKRPLKDNPYKYAAASRSSSHTTPTVLINYQDETTIDCSQGDASSMRWYPSGTHYCDKSLKEDMKCTGNEVAWTSTPVKLSGDKTIAKLDGSKVTPGKAFTANAGCSDKDYKAWVFILFAGIPYNPPSEELVLGAAHLCSTGEGASMSNPCEKNLKVNETVVINCSHLRTSVGGEMTTVPANISREDGEYCTALPSGDSKACAETKSWEYIKIKSDARGIYFTITNDADEARKRRNFSAYGWCYDNEQAMAWKINVQGTKPEVPSEVTTHCSFDEDTGPRYPCWATVFLGEAFSYDCGADDEVSPPEANSWDAKYCEKPYASETSACPPENLKTLDPMIGSGLDENGRFYVISNGELHQTFQKPIHFHVRCKRTLNDVVSYMYVKATILPLPRPAPLNPATNVDIRAPSSPDHPAILFNFKDASTIVACGKSTDSVTLVPSTVADNDGKFCSAPIDQYGQCKSRFQQPWKDKSVKLTESSAQILHMNGTDVAERFPAYLYCANGDRKLWVGILFTGYEMAPPIPSKVERATHLCSTGKDSYYGHPCTIDLPIGETAVISCAHYRRGNNAIGYKMYPPNVDQQEGQYCVALPESTNGTCDMKKWSGVEVKSATIEGYFTVTNLQQGSEKREDYVAMGFCKDGGKSFSWKLDVWGGKKREVVKHCAFGKNSTPSDPCDVMVFLGEAFSYDCPSYDIASPEGSNTREAKYCKHAFTSGTDSCREVGKLESEGIVKGSLKEVYVQLRDKPIEDFGRVRTYYTRCKGKDSGALLFVKARFMPFPRPHINAPDFTASHKDVTSISAPKLLYNFQNTTTIHCQLKNLPVTYHPTGTFRSGGKYCSALLTDPAKCPQESQHLWSEKNVNNSDSRQESLVLDGKAVTETFAANVGCTSDNKSLYTTVLFTGMEFKPPSYETVKRAKQFCSTGSDGWTYSNPCEVELEVGETVLISCAHYHLSEDVLTYTMFPKDTNRLGGHYCASLPDQPVTTCQEERWSDVEINADPLYGYFTITNDPADAKLREDFTATGFCKNGEKAMAWKIKVYGGKSNEDDSAGSSLSTGAMGLIALIALSLLTSSSF